MMIRDLIEKPGRKRTAASVKAAEPAGIAGDFYEDGQYLDAILQGSPIAGYVIDKFHRIIHWNRALENLVGIKAQGILGTDQHWRIFYDSRRLCLVDFLVNGNRKINDLIRWYRLKYVRSALVEDAYEAVDFFPTLGLRGKWLRFTATPLKNAGGEIFGAMETFEDITDLKEVEQALRESEKRHIELSITDDLTRLYNSRHFFSQLEIEIGRARRYGHPLSLLMMDIDDFKQLNDSYGHLEGDRILRRIGGLVAELIRKTDSAYRYGGEEFAVILPETTGNEAVPVAERIRTGIESEKFLCEGDDVGITISIGIAQYHLQETFTDLVKTADKRMYAAKRQGKNCVFFPVQPTTPVFEKDYVPTKSLHT